MYDILHTKADFDWADEDADGEEEEYTGNEGTNIERFYHRAGILLLPRDEMWKFIEENIKPEALVKELQHAASLTSTIDFDRCIRLIGMLQPHLAKTPSLQPPTLNALCSLYDRAAKENEEHDAPSSYMEQLNSLVDRVFAESVINFNDVSTPTQLDKLVSTGIDSLSTALASAFKRSLTGSSAAARKYPLSLLDSANFLLRLFLLDLEPQWQTSYYGERVAKDPLPALLSGLPQSADTARLPPHWVKSASAMCEMLCSELNVNRLDQTPELHNVSTAAETTVAVLLLFALYHRQRCSDAAQRADYTDHFVYAAIDYCQFASQRIEAIWSNKPTDEDVRQTIEKKLIAPLLSIIDLIQLSSPSDGDATDDESQLSLLAAILLLPQRLLSCLQAQLAALPSESTVSWAYPTNISALFSGTSRPAFSRYDVRNDRCDCEVCYRAVWVPDERHRTYRQLPYYWRREEAHGAAHTITQHPTSRAHYYQDGRHTVHAAN